MKLPLQHFQQVIRLTSHSNSQEIQTFIQVYSNMQHLTHPELIRLWCQSNINIVNASQGDCKCLVQNQVHYSIFCSPKTYESLENNSIYF
jgi:hypothetical protein